MRTKNPNIFWLSADLCVAFFMITMMLSLSVHATERQLYFHFGDLTRQSLKLSLSLLYSWAATRLSYFYSLVSLWRSSTVCHFVYYQPMTLTCMPNCVIFVVLDRLALQCSSVCRWYINPLLPLTTLLQQRYHSFHRTSLLAVCATKRKCSVLLLLLYYIIVFIY